MKLTNLVSAIVTTTKIVMLVFETRPTMIEFCLSISPSSCKNGTPSILDIPRDTIVKICIFATLGHLRTISFIKMGARDTISNFRKAKTY